MGTHCLEPYRDVSHHQEISRIIHTFSINKEEPSTCFFDGLDLKRATRVLDLGCGFGFMAGHLAERVAPSALIIGVDACPANHGAFVEAVSRSGREAHFICASIADRLPFDDAYFDVVLCSYSLYFFVKAVPEIARVMRRDGCFVAISHSIDFIDELLRVAGITKEQVKVYPRLNQVFGAFCLENGYKLLQPHFENIQTVSYQNQMRFHKENGDALLAYVIHKLPFIFPDHFRDDAVIQSVAASVAAYLTVHAEVTINKDDCCFRCTGPSTKGISR